MASISAKTPDYIESMVFGQKLKILTSAKKMIPSERASKEEQNGANFSFIAPSVGSKRITKNGLDFGQNA